MIQLFWNTDAVGICSLKNRYISLFFGYLLLKYACICSYMYDVAGVVGVCKNTNLLANIYVIRHICDWLWLVVRLI